MGLLCDGRECYQVSGYYFDNLEDLRLCISAKPCSDKCHQCPVKVSNAKLFVYLWTHLKFPEPHTLPTTEMMEALSLMDFLAHPKANLLRYKLPRFNVVLGNRGSGKSTFIAKELLFTGENVIVVCGSATGRDLWARYVNAKSILAEEALPQVIETRRLQSITSVLHLILDDVDMRSRDLLLPFVHQLHNFQTRVTASVQSVRNMHPGVRANVDAVAMLGITNIKEMKMVSSEFASHICYHVTPSPPLIVEPRQSNKQQLFSPLSGRTT